MKPPCPQRPLPPPPTLTLTSTSVTPVPSNLPPIAAEAPINHSPPRRFSRPRPPPPPRSSLGLPPPPPPTPPPPVHTTPPIPRPKRKSLITRCVSRSIGSTPAGVTAALPGSDVSTSTAPQTPHAPAAPSSLTSLPPTQKARPAATSSSPEPPLPVSTLNRNTFIADPTATSQVNGRTDPFSHLVAELRQKLARLSKPAPGGEDDDQPAVGSSHLEALKDAFPLVKERSTSTTSAPAEAAAAGGSQSTDDTDPPEPPTALSNLREDELPQEPIQVIVPEMIHPRPIVIFPSPLVCADDMLDLSDQQLEPTARVLHSDPPSSSTATTGELNSKSTSPPNSTRENVPTSVVHLNAVGSTTPVRHGDGSPFRMKCLRTFVMASARPCLYSQTSCSYKIYHRINAVSSLVAVPIASESPAAGRTASTRRSMGRPPPPTANRSGTSSNNNAR